MTTKTTNLLYWISTILFAGLMTFTAIPNIMNNAESKQLIHDFLGYPVYFIPFIGWAKLLGSITILIPGLYKLKEWAYAGLFFDLVSSVYSAIAASGTFDPMMLTLLAWVIPGIVSYALWSKKVKKEILSAHTA